MNDTWSELLNPKVVRERLVRAGLYLLAHEVLVDAIKRPIHEFFSNNWSPEFGWKFSDEYRMQVLALDPKGKSDPMRASIAWLEQAGVIGDSEIEDLRTLTEARNRFAHELSRIVTTGEMPPVEALFPKCVDLVTRIGRWWIVNVELAVDERGDDSGCEPSQVVPGTTVLLQVLDIVVLGKESDAWELYREYIDEFGPS